MRVKLKSPQEIAIMADAGKILANIHSQLSQIIDIGVSTIEIDKYAEDLCKKNKVAPAFLGYNGYKYTTCIGHNNIAIHGLPSAQKLQSGDVMSVDIGVKHKGYYSDMAMSYAIGNVDQSGTRLISTTKLALQSAVAQAIDGNTLGDIGFAMNSVVQMAGFSVIYQMVGHGIGQDLHEAPEVPCYGQKGTGLKLQNGMVLAIEAMVNEGDGELLLESDGWTMTTADGKRSCIFEHTVAVGLKKPKILTE